eukprot:11951511-Alexandrium_andersonii.AAC.1
MGTIAVAIDVFGVVVALAAHSLLALRARADRASALGLSCSVRPPVCLAVAATRGGGGGCR